jgi:hypothetical protein
VAALGLDVAGLEAVVVRDGLDDAVDGDDLAGPGDRGAEGLLGELEVDAALGQRGVCREPDLLLATEITGTPRPCSPTPRP